MMRDLAFKPNSRPIIMLGAAIIVSIGGLQGYRLLQSQAENTKKTQVSEITIPQIQTVTALGRLEPKGKVIKLSAPTSSQGSRVEQLLVQEGEKVKTGQVIAILDNRPRLQAAF